MGRRWVGPQLGEETIVMAGMRGVLVRMRWPAVAISLAAVVLAIAGSAAGTAASRRAGSATRAGRRAAR